MAKKHMILLLLSVSLASCGTMPEDRAISGAGIGAAGGAIIGAVTGLTVLEGAAIGAVTGALTGVLTDKDKINMGKPVWKKGTASVSDPPTSAQATEGKHAVAASAPGRHTVAVPVSDHETNVAGNGPSLIADKRVVMEIQSGLIRLGYEPGPVDGINGKRTRKAIRAYQEYHGLAVDGRATLELAEHIRTRSNYRSNYIGEVQVQQTSFPL